jgi:hypothetical protein
LNDTSSVSPAALLAGPGAGLEAGQGGGYLFRPDRQRGIAGIAHQPLEFDADPLRRAGLETDPVNVRFGVRFREARPLYHDLEPYPMGLTKPRALALAVGSQVEVVPCSTSGGDGRPQDP